VQVAFPLSQVEYRRRTPEQELLYEVLREHPATFLAQTGTEGGELPGSGVDQNLPRRRGASVRHFGDRRARPPPQLELEYVDIDYNTACPASHAPARFPWHWNPDTGHFSRMENGIRTLGLGANGLSFLLIRGLVGLLIIAAACNESPAAPSDTAETQPTDSPDSGVPDETDQGGIGQTDTAVEPTDTEPPTSDTGLPDDTTDTTFDTGTGQDTGTDTTPPATFRNPLNTIRGSDPFTRYYNGYYYLTATTWTNQLTMKRATTLEGLKSAQEQVIREETDTTTDHCCNMWAPEFFLLDGPHGPRWYYYYTAGRSGDDFGYQRMYVLESIGTDPMGPYTFVGQIYDVAGWWAIDGSVLEHGGSRYFLFSRWQGENQCLWIAPMDNPWTIGGSAQVISCPEYDWERHDSNVNEGPEALQRNGRTFIVYSASGCMGYEYKLGLLELTAGGDPMDPADWVKAPEPVFSWRESGQQGVYGPGHNGIFKSPDNTEWWHVYHANTGPDDGCYIWRTTRAQKINWTADGTPDFGVPAFLDEDLVVPSGE